MTEDSTQDKAALITKQLCLESTTMLPSSCYVCSLLCGSHRAQLMFSDRALLLLDVINKRNKYAIVSGIYFIEKAAKKREPAKCQTHSPSSHIRIDVFQP